MGRTRAGAANICAVPQHCLIDCPVTVEEKVVAGVRPLQYTLSPRDIRAFLYLSTVVQEPVGMIFHCYPPPPSPTSTPPTVHYCQASSRFPGQFGKQISMVMLVYCKLVGKEIFYNTQYKKFTFCPQLLLKLLTPVTVRKWPLKFLGQRIF